jgi:inner membrane protein
MDNLSHTVVGLAAGEFIHRRLPAEPAAEHNCLRRRLLLITCGFASNFPDLDLVLTPLLPEPLGYLLHHRGHTHTLLYALPQALLLWALILLLWPAARRLLKQSPRARLGMGLALAAGFGLHMAMDYLNSYGIHPWHPFDSRWFYGDLVFILEPVFWVGFGVPLIMMIPRRWLAAALGLLSAGLLVFLTMRGYLLWPSLAALTAVALAVGLTQARASARGTAALVLAGLTGIGFIGAQSVASTQAKRMLAQSLQRIDPDSRLLDISMTAFPANPFCWNFVTVESKESAGLYRLRRGMLSLGQADLPVSACPPGLSEWRQAAAAKMTTVADATSGVQTIVFFAQEEGDLRLLRQLEASNCFFAAWLRFARAPYLDAGTASDLRFASTPRGNFTTFRLNDFRGADCPLFVPGWDVPRSDLLGRVR